MLLILWEWLSEEMVNLMNAEAWWKVNSIFPSGEVVHIMAAAGSKDPGTYVCTAGKVKVPNLESPGLKDDGTKADAGLRR